MDGTLRCFQHARHDAGSTSVVTTSATQMTSGATLLNDVRCIEVANSTGEDFFIFVNSESTAKPPIIHDVGNDLMPFHAKAGDILKLQAVTNTAATGRININCLG